MLRLSVFWFVTISGLLIREMTVTWECDGTESVRCRAARQGLGERKTQHMTNKRIFTIADLQRPAPSHSTFFMVLGYVVTFSL